ncbi:34644_t:CDS:2, partial [Racocetra persica]
YNASRSDLDTLPENTIQQFKAILVHYIHKQLPKGSKQLGKQSVSVPATENWGIKFYEQRQYTYIVLCDDKDTIDVENLIV